MIDGLSSLFQYGRGRKLCKAGNYISITLLSDAMYPCEESLTMEVRELGSLEDLTGFVKWFDERRLAN